MIRSRRIFFVVLFLLLILRCSQVFAQGFLEKWNVALPPSMKIVAGPEWGDMDNDGLLDVVILSQTNSVRFEITILKGDTVNTPSLESASVFLAFEGERMFLFDYNFDNNLDIIIPDIDPFSPARIYVNEGDFTFQPAISEVPSFTSMIYTDINNDITPEWIINHASDNVYTFSRSSTGWACVDTIAMRAKTIDAFDADGDGFKDLFLSGRVSADSIFAGFMINQGGFKYAKSGHVAIDATSSRGDINHDGVFDMILRGVDNGGNSVTKVYLSSGNGFQLRDTVINAISPAMFIADFDSDGLADINYWSKNDDGDSISLIKTRAGYYDTLDLHQVIAERFADADHDGDLDLLQMKKTDSVRLVLYDNEALLNYGPAVPTEVNGFLFLDHIFMSWRRSADDHTRSEAITYDIYLDGANAADFDILNGKRLKSSHGNNASGNFILAKIPEVGSLQFVLEPVDNSLHANGGNGNCTGVLQHCAQLNVETIAMCTRESRVFTAPPNSSWFSFSSGFLKSGGSLAYTAMSNDVIFHYQPSNPGCASLKAYVIEINDATREESFIKYACVDQEIELSVDPSWSRITWDSQSGGTLSQDPVLHHVITGADVISATLLMGTGCKVIQHYDIKLSKPEVNATAENTHVFEGRSIQVQASGAEHYTWSPASGFDDIHSATPIFTPSGTGDITVTGYDSIGCFNIATLNITVERKGFIPSLFTPNNDGNNDNLKVYGLFAAQEFSLEIFNRSGSTVFSATSVSSSWDGTTRGIKQPAGVYFWRVKGRLISGEQVQLNGKQAGSIVLLR